MLHTDTIPICISFIMGGSLSHCSLVGFLINSFTARQYWNFLFSIFDSASLQIISRATIFSTTILYYSSDPWTKINRSFFQCYDLAQLIECCYVRSFRSEERLKAIAFLEFDSTPCSVPSERSAITQMKDGQRRMRLNANVPFMVHLDLIPCCSGT